MKRGPEWVRTKKGWKRRSELRGPLWDWMEYPDIEYQVGNISWLRWRYEQLKRLRMPSQKRRAELKSDAVLSFWWYWDEILFRVERTSVLVKRRFMNSLNYRFFCLKRTLSKWFWNYM